MKEKKLFTHYSISPTVIQIMNLATTHSYSGQSVNYPTGVPSRNARPDIGCNQLLWLLTAKRCTFPSLKWAYKTQPKIQENEISPPTKQGLSLWIFYCEKPVGWKSLSSLTNPGFKQPVIKCKRISSVLNLAHIWFSYTWIQAYDKRLTISPKYGED